MSLGPKILMPLKAAVNAEDLVSISIQAFQVLSSCTRKSVLCGQTKIYALASLGSAPIKPKLTELFDCE